MSESQEMKQAIDLLFICSGADKDEKCLLRYLEKGADLNAVDPKGVGALFMACAAGNVAGVKELFRRGININVRNDSGLTPLLGAIISGREEVVRELVNHGVDVSVKDSAGTSPLGMALLTERSDIARILVGAGASCNVNDLTPNPYLQISFREQLEMIFGKPTSAAPQPATGSVPRKSLATFIKEKLMLWWENYNKERAKEVPFLNF